MPSRLHRNMRIAFTTKTTRSVLPQGTSTSTAWAARARCSCITVHFAPARDSGHASHPGDIPYRFAYVPTPVRNEGEAADCTSKAFGSQGMLRLGELEAGKLYHKRS